MGCIELTISRVGEAMSSMTARLGEVARFSVAVPSIPLKVLSSRLDEMEYSTSRADEQMIFTCGLVCSTSEAFFLNVEPEYIWLLPENDFSEDVVVYANVSWTIE